MISAHIKLVTGANKMSLVFKESKLNKNLSPAWESNQFEFIRLDYDSHSGVASSNIGNIYYLFPNN